MQYVQLCIRDVDPPKLLAGMFQNFWSSAPLLELRVITRAKGSGMLN
jgi:hypothetical protein